MRPILAILAMAAWLVCTTAGPVGGGWGGVAQADSLQEAILEAKAKQSGDPDDALDVARYHDKQKGKGADKQALEWYGKAVEGYLKEKKRGKAEAALAAMKKVDAKHPTVVKLEARLGEGKGGSSAAAPPGAPKAAPAPPSGGSTAGKAPPPAAPPGAQPPKTVPKAPALLPVAGPPLDQALAAIQRKDDAAARPILEAHAKGNNPVAQYHLGLLLYNDLKAERTAKNQWDASPSLALFRQAADAGHLASAYVASLVILNTSQINLNDVEQWENAALADSSLAWRKQLEADAKAGRMAAVRALGKAYRLQHGAAGTKAKFHDLVTPVAEVGDPFAMMDLAWAYLGPEEKFPAGQMDVMLGIAFGNQWAPKSPTLATHWLGEAGKLGYANAYATLGLLQFKGGVLPKDLAASKRWYEQLVPIANEQIVDTLNRSTQQSDPGAYFALGRIRSEGGGSVSAWKSLAPGYFRESVKHYAAAKEPVLACSALAALKAVRGVMPPPTKEIADSEADAKAANGGKPCP